LSVSIVLLMAGEGRRAWPLTRDRPKALLEFDTGRSIVDLTLSSMAESLPPAKILPVVGHAFETAVRAISRHPSHDDVEPVLNPFYATAGPLVSVWLALHRNVGEQVIIVNGDTVVRSGLADAVAGWLASVGGSPEARVTVCGSHDPHPAPDDMKVRLGERSRVLEVGKNVSVDDASHVSAGVVCLGNRAAIELARSVLDQMVMEAGSLARQRSWHSVVNELAESIHVEFVEVDRTHWHEVDVHLDLDTLNNLLGLRSRRASG
jgi:choline kinase